MTYPITVLPGHTVLGHQQPAAAPDRTGRLEDALGRAIRHYQARHQRPEAEPARQFLDERHITAETMERLQLGYATSGWHPLTNTLKREGFSDQVLDAGISGRAGTGRLYDHLRGRVVFPIQDHSGRPVGFPAGSSSVAAPSASRAPKPPCTERANSSTGSTSPGPTSSLPTTP